MFHLEFWSNISDDKKTKFIAEKQALVDNVHINFKTHPECKGDDKRLQHKVKVKKKGGEVTMNEVPNSLLPEVPRALEEAVNAKVANFFANNESNSIHEDPCVPPVLVMDTPIPSQHTNCQTNDGSDESDVKSPKKRGGAKKKRTMTDPNEPEDESPLSSSVSSSDSNDLEEEFDPFSGSTYFRLSDFSGLKLPQFPVSDATCKTWCRNFMTKATATGDHLLTSKSNRIKKLSRRTRTNGCVKGEPSQAFKKRLRAWTKRDK